MNNGTLRRCERTRLYIYSAIYTRLASAIYTRLHVYISQRVPDQSLIKKQSDQTRSPHVRLRCVCMQREPRPKETAQVRWDAFARGSAAASVIGG